LHGTAVRQSKGLFGRRGGARFTPGIFVFRFESRCGFQEIIAAIAFRSRSWQKNLRRRKIFSTDRRRDFASVRVVAPIKTACPTRAPKDCTPLSVGNSSTAVEPLLKRRDSLVVDLIAAGRFSMRTNPSSRWRRCRLQPILDVEPPFFRWRLLSARRAGRRLGNAAVAQT